MRCRLWSRLASTCLREPTPGPVRAGPHVPTSLAGDDELVTVGPEVAPQVLAKIGLGAAVGRAVVVGQVKVRDARIERGAQHLALTGQRRGIAKVVPQAE